MTTRTGARIYRGQSRPLAPGACPHCGRDIAIGANGRRHRNRDRHPCTGGGVMVSPLAVHIDGPVHIPIPPNRQPSSRTADRPHRERPPDLLLCICGWHPKTKKDGTFAAHRIDPNDPTSPYCANGAPRSRQ